MSVHAHATAETSGETHELDVFLAPFIKAHHRKHGSARAGAKGSNTGKSNAVVSLFDVPPGLLANAAREADQSPLSLDSPNLSTDFSSTWSRIIQADRKSARGLTCIRCGLNFESRSAQLEHFKTRLHLINLRRHLSGQPPLTQDQLDEAPAMTGAIDREDDEADDSSGSESDDTRRAENVGVLLQGLDQEGEDADRDVPTAESYSKLDNEERINGNAISKRGRVRREFSLREGPRFTFSPAGWAWCFSVSAVALGMERGDDPWERLEGMFGDGDGGGGNRLWAVVILQSGKFAAAVFEGQAVVCHKVFKRYTIRAKRGGSQSSYDSGGRKALSAGATLRRYGEQALREDVRVLLKEWAEILKACRVILTSVPKGMRAVLFDGKDAPFDRKDPRLRATPFAIGRPTFEEVVDVHARVTSIVFSDASGDATAPDKEQTSASADSKTDAGGSAGEKSGKKLKATEAGGGPIAPHENILDAEPCPPSLELLGACARGDVDAAAALLDRLDLGDHVAGVATAASSSGGSATPPAPSGAIPASTVPSHSQLEGADTLGWIAEEVINRPDGMERLMTPLHLAAAGGHVSVLGVLLERGANPLAEDVRGRVPFLLAANKDTRDAFRRARAAQPGRWDWNAARVPESLTKELEQRQKEKSKDKEKEKKRRAKLRKKAEKEKGEEEARQKKEREAAEAEERRRRGLAAVGHCDACGKAVVPKKAFSRLEYRYCSTVCVNAHKRTLAAEAAERRLKGGGS